MQKPIVLDIVVDYTGCLNSIARVEPALKIRIMME